MTDKPQNGETRLKRIQGDTLRLAQDLTSIRTRPAPYTAQELRDLAGKADAISAHLFQIANELEADS